MATFDFVKIIYFYLSGNILQLKLNILQWSDKLMFALSACRLSNILLPADYMRAHRAVIAGQSRPPDPTPERSAPPPEEEYYSALSQL